MTQWKLVSGETCNAINIGDELVTFRGERIRLTGMQPPHKPEASGKVFCENESQATAPGTSALSVAGSSGTKPPR